MLHLEDKHWKIVKNILSKYPYTFYAFGSRVKGTQKRFSDLDLCVKDTIPWNVKALMDEDFEESELPFSVDIIDWNMIDQAFRDRIQEDLIVIN